MASVTDNKIQELFKIVQKKKEEIIQAEKPNWFTNLSFGYDKSSSQRTNIQVVSDVNELVNIVGFIIDKKESFDKAQKLLGTNEKFTWLGYSDTEWISDIKTRINKIQISKKKHELNELENRLSSLISPELRAQMELEEISKLLEG